MSYVRHHAIIVTGLQYGSHRPVEDAHSKAVQLGCSVSPIVCSTANGYLSFCVFPDGSGERWPASEAGNNQRSAFVTWLEEKGCVRWAEVQYGDEDGDQRVLRASNLRTED